MTRNSPRLIIADPSLLDTRGHHFSLTLQISKGASELGVQTVWLTHKDFVIPEWMDDDIKVLPFFTITMYDRYRAEKKSDLPHNIEEVIYDEILSAFLLLNANKEDHVFFHTGFGDIYRLLPSYLSNKKIEELPYFHICTPYQPNGMPGRDHGDDVVNVLENMKNITAVDKKLFFWAETPQLATYYTLTYGFNTRALLLPPPVSKPKGKKQCNAEPFVASYLGAAREEKGFLHLPEIVKNMFESHGRNGKLKFVIQCSPQIVGYIPSIASAIEELSQYPESYVKLVRDVLSEDDYHEYLNDSDLLILLYDRKNYRIRGSGIGVEAISANKCILTFNNTFCASLIKYGGGASINDIDEAIPMLSKIVDNKHNYLARAKLQGEEYRTVNCAKNYVSRIISQTEAKVAPSFFPSNVIGCITMPLLKV